LYLREFLESKKLSIDGDTARQLISYVIEYKRTDRLSLFNNIIELDDGDIKHLEDISERLLKEEPLSYIINKRYFFRDEFYVDENVMIPRFETEILVEKLIRISADKNILELGTGSGCIAISCLKHSKANTFTSTDISEKALNIASINADNLLDSQRIKDLYLICSDKFEGIKGKFDIIVSNPPYIDFKQYLKLDSSVRDYEPEKALTDNGDGLSYYNYILNQCDRLLVKGGTILFEHGYDQRGQIMKFCEEKFNNVESIKDYSEHDRFIFASDFVEIKNYLL